MLPANHSTIVATVEVRFSSEALPMFVESCSEIILPWGRNEKKSISLTQIFIVNYLFCLTQQCSQQSQHCLLL